MLGRTARTATVRNKASVSVLGAPDGRRATKTANPRTMYSAARMRSVTALNSQPSGFGFGGPVATHALAAAELSQRTPQPMPELKASQRRRRLLGLTLPQPQDCPTPRISCGLGWRGLCAVRTGRDSTDRLLNAAVSWHRGYPTDAFCCDDLRELARAELSRLPREQDVRTR